jgi:hypothetical protein
MLRLGVWVILGMVILPGCLYVMAAKLAVSTVSRVASGIASRDTSPEVEIPKEKSAIIEAYKNCVKQSSSNLQLDCSRYQKALEAQIKKRPSSLYYSSPVIRDEAANPQ